jgi:cytochrome c oxidase subunit IV
MSDHVSPVSLYLTIFAALMILTGVTVAAAYLNLGQFNFAVAIGIAGFKASLVIWYFMHVKYQSHLTKLTLALGLFFLAILLGMSLIDYMSRYNFRGEPPLPPANPASVIAPAPPAH